MENEDANTKQSDQLMPVFRQVMVVGITCVFIIYMVHILPKLAAPGASVALFSCAMAVAIGLVVLHLPPVIFRRSRGFQRGAYGVLVAGFLLVMVSINQVSRAYDMTPQGAAELAALENEKRIAAAGKAEARQQSKLEGCMSWSGRLSVLEADVKSNLHNPDSFQHVATQILGSAPDGDNVEMTFRAQNGFGALRKTWVRARLNPETCELESVGRLMD